MIICIVRETEINNIYEVEFKLGTHKRDVGRHFYTKFVSKEEAMTFLRLTDDKEVYVKSALDID